MKLIILLVRDEHNQSALMAIRSNIENEVWDLDKTKLLYFKLILVQEENDPKITLFLRTQMKFKILPIQDGFTQTELQVLYWESDEHYFNFQVDLAYPWRI